MKAIIIGKNKKVMDEIDTYLELAGVDHIAWADSISFGLKQIVDMFENETPFDYLVLEMKLSEESNSNIVCKIGALRVLEELKKREIPIKAIIVTNDDNVDSKSYENLESIVDVIEYDVKTWQANRFVEALKK